VSASDLSGLLTLSREYGAGLTVEFVEFPHSEWEMRDGRIVHRLTDFFSVVGQRDDSGVERVLFRQPETALVGLLTAVVRGERHVLLNARAEPGLHGGCQFSTTVQSTPSNYERRHGGAATPLIEIFLDSATRARVVHDSMQYDWGQYYDAKVKRFLILEIDELLPVEAPLTWVGEAVFQELLGVDFAVTCDLRAAAVALSSPNRATPATPSASRQGAPVDVPLAELHNWRMHPTGIDEIDPVQGVAIRYVTTRAPSREVNEWSQPLMLVDEPLDICLPVRTTAEGTECAVQLRSAPGLRGAPLWYPAALTDPASATAKTAHAVRSSAEGGRFLRHEIRVSSIAAADDEVVADSRWVSLPELHGWTLADRCTSVELRLALAMLFASSRAGSR
jgi:hypothetical protein